MPRFQDLPLKQKFFRVVVFMGVAVILMTVGVLIVTDLIRFRRTMVEELSTLANIIGNNTTAALSFNDPKSAEETLSAMRADPNILAAQIYTKHLTHFASYFRQGEKKDPLIFHDQIKDGHTFGRDYLDIYKPIFLDRQRIGMIYIRSDLVKFYSRLRWYGVMLIIIIGISIILTLVFSFVLQKNVLNPISHLTQTMKKVSGEKDYTIQVGKESNDEVGILVDEFNEMLGQIRKRDEALKEAEKKYRAIFENAITGIFQASLGGRFISANPALAKIHGYDSPEELINSVTDITRQLYVDPSRRKDYLQLIHGKGKISDFEFQSFRKDGTLIWVSMNAQAVRDKDGEILFVEGSAQDITDRKRAEEEVKEKSEELARSNKELEQFAYVASHDLQEPLRMVTSYVQLLAKRYQGKLDRDANDFIEFAVDGAMRMHRLINDLLAYSRVGTQGKALASTDSEVVFGEVLSNLRVAIEEKGATVIHEPLPTVMADDVQLGQLFQNLVGNAIKFHREEAPQVQVSAHQSNGEWVFSVKDNGIGIDPKFKELIFVIFQRLHGKGEYPGTGIGLAVCKKIVERHGGRIWVESEPGRGAAFYFTIPTIQEQRR
jgi:PAS domain S-box-containing protein